MADSIGTKIKKRRQALGIRTQQELADLVGVSRTTVSDWESGRHLPERFIGKLEEVLGPLDEDLSDRMYRLQREMDRLRDEIRDAERDQRSRTAL